MILWKKNLEILLSSLADLQIRQNVHQSWLRNVARAEQAQKQFLEKRKLDNTIRQNKGQEPLSETQKELEIENPLLFKRIQEPWKANLESLLISHRISGQCQQISKFGGQTLTKEFLAKSIESSNKLL